MTKFATCPVAVLSSILLAITIPHHSVAFQTNYGGMTLRRMSSTTSTELAVVGKIMGRFRKKKTVDISPQITVGSSLPKADVEIVTSTNADGTVESTPTEISDVLGTSGTSLLVGMPGAYTTTCTKKHLPGYINAAPTLNRLGVNTIAVVTTNDRFVNSAWAEELGILNGASSGDDGDKNGNEQPITILSDGDGDLVRELGLADDMGFGVGVRSKRFAMLVKNGKVDYVTTDDGMDDCDSSSAEAVVQYLSPEAEIGDGDGEGGGLAIVAGGAVLVAALSSGVFGGGGGSSPPPAPARKPAIERSAPAAKSQPVQKPSGGFSLLEEYK